MKRLFLYLLLLWAVPAVAQRADFGLARRMMRSQVYMNEVRPHFLPGSDKFWYMLRGAAGEEYWFVDPAHGEKRPMFDNARFAEGLKNLIGIELNPSRMEIPDFEFSKDERSFFIYPGPYKVTYDFYKHEFTGVEEVGMPQEERPQSSPAKKSPDGKYELFARGHNLFVRETATGKEKQLTTDGEPYYSYSTVADRMPRGDAPTIAFWLDDSRRVAYSRVDTRRMAEMPLLNSLTTRPTVAIKKYDVPGDREVNRFDAGVIDVETGKIVPLQKDKWKDQAFDIIYASPDGSFLYILRKSRLLQDIELCRADTRTGEVRVLVSDHAEPYLNDQLMQYSFLNGGRDIILFSERTGRGHLYHYNGEGKLLNAITEGEWTTGRIVRIDTLRNEIFFEGYGYKKGNNPYYTQLFRANINKKGVQLLTPEEANHKTIVSPGGYVIDNFSRPDLAPASVLRDRNGKLIAELSHADISAWQAEGWQMPERFTVKATDGVTDLYGTMWKPIDFDPAKKYPIITHVYPGPQSENLQLDFHPTGGYDGPLAQLGCIVVNFGNRGGSALRGAAYHTFGHGNLRDYAIEDNKHGLEQLAARHEWIDRDRVGIFGNSGGGAMTFAAMCKYPDFYKAGVSASGNHDNRIFNRWWGETHHGITQEVNGQDTVFLSPQQTSLEIAQHLKGHLMLVTGDMDDVVYPSQSYRLADALIKYGKNFEFVVLPGQGHDFVQSGKTYYQFKTWLHFARYLLGDATPIVDMGRAWLE